MSESGCFVFQHLRVKHHQCHAVPLRCLLHNRQFSGQQSESIRNPFRNFPAPGHFRKRNGYFIDISGEKEARGFGNSYRCFIRSKREVYSFDCGGYGKRWTD